jgi:hypothetical protein
MFEGKEVVKKLVVAALVSTVVGIVFCGGCPKKEKAAASESAPATDVTNVEPVTDAAETKTDVVNLEEATETAEADAAKTGDNKTEGTETTGEAKADDTKKEV